MYRKPDCLLKAGLVVRGGMEILMVEGGLRVSGSRQAHLRAAISR